jgi:hypothetical protein
MVAGVGHNSRQQVVVYPRMIEVGVWRQSLVGTRNSGWFTKPAGGWLGGSGGSPDRSVKCSRAPPLNLSTEPNDRQPPGVLIPGFGAAPPSTIQLGTTRLQLQVQSMTANPESVLIACRHCHAWPMAIHTRSRPRQGILPTVLICRRCGHQVDGPKIHDEQYSEHCEAPAKETTQRFDRQV